MNKNIVTGVITFAVGLLFPQIIQAQGIVYTSNLGQGLGNDLGVGSNSWLAVSLQTGTNAGGYVLNSIQLEMGNAFGSPGGFTTMVYSASPGQLPGSSLGTLDGSSNPTTSGIYTYTSDSNLTLPPQSFYYIVLMAGTPFVSGAAGTPVGYVWDRALNTGSCYNPIGSWLGTDAYGYSSNYGSSWNFISGIDLQYAISATAIPEPCVLSLFALGAMGILWQRRKTKAHYEKLIIHSAFVFATCLLSPVFAQAQGTVCLSNLSVIGWQACQ